MWVCGCVHARVCIFRKDMKHVEDMKHLAAMLVVR